MLQSPLEILSLHDSSGATTPHKQASGRTRDQSHGELILEQERSVGTARVYSSVAHGAQSSAEVRFKSA